MNEISLNITRQELDEVVNAYATLQKILTKIIPAEDLYKPEFINGMNESLKELENNKIDEVTGFKEFVE
jgi:hypothetical protein